MKEFLIIITTFFVLMLIFIKAKKNIYPFFKNFLKQNYIKTTNSSTNNYIKFDFEEPDIENFIYIPRIKNFKEIFLKELVKDRYIEISIPENVLYFYVLDQRGEFILHSKYPVSVGRPKTPTMIGEGLIYTKGKIIFKYLYGPNQGKIIEYSKMPDGSKIKIPYEKMFGLYMIINNSDRYVIHSTTEYYNIGKPVSSGCVRMLIEDMLKLYPLIKTPIKVKIKYNLFKLENEFLTVYPDIYNRSLNRFNELLEFLEQNGINVLIFDFIKLKNVLLNKEAITVSLNELLNDYFIKRNLTYDKIKIENLKKDKKFVDILENKIFFK